MPIDTKAFSVDSGPDAQERIAQALERIAHALEVGNAIAAVDLQDDDEPKPAYLSTK